MLSQHCAVTLVLPTEVVSDLLVNEGLATLLEYGCMANVLPQQLGTTGAAVLMKHVAVPHGQTPGRLEGKTCFTHQQQRVAGACAARPAA